VIRIGQISDKDNQMFNLIYSVVHALNKEQHEPIQPSTIKEEVLESEDDGVEKLLSGVVKTYGSRNNSAHYGVFRAEGEGRGAFPDKFDDYVNTHNPSPDDFLDLSKTAMDELYGKAEVSSLASGGYMLFADYTQDGTRFFLTVMIKQKEGLTLTKDLQPEALMQLDLNKLHQAARINVAKYLRFWDGSEEEQSELVYLSFVSPHPGKGASGYFVTALGCQAGSTSKKATEALIKASSAFFRGEDDLAAARSDFRNDLIAYLEGKKNSGELVKLSEIDALARNYMPADEPGRQDELSDAFMAFLNNEENAIPAEFAVSTSALNGYLKINVKANNWQIKFDRSALGSDAAASIYFDQNTNKIVLSDVPEDVRILLTDELKFRELNGKQ
jgi:nucleoid-associated protein